MLCFYTEYKVRRRSRRRRKVRRRRRRRKEEEKKGWKREWGEWREMLYINVITGLGDRKCILL